MSLPGFFLELDGLWELWETRLADQVMLLGSLGGARNSQAGGSQPGVVISSSRGDRQDVINKTNLPKAPLPLIILCGLEKLGLLPAHPGLKKM